MIFAWVFLWPSGWRAKRALRHLRLPFDLLRLLGLRIRGGGEPDQHRPTWLTPRPTSTLELRLATQPSGARACQPAEDKADRYFRAEFE